MNKDEEYYGRILPLFLACTFLFSIAQIEDLHAKVPSYRVVKTEDVSYGNVRRLNIRVSVPDHYSRTEVEQIAMVIVADVRREQRLNAISIMFFGPNTPPSGEWDIASVDWAPNGRWEDAGTVQPGDYWTFRYSVNYKPPIEASATKLELEPSGKLELEPSGKVGLLGTPLPVGATLEKVGHGDPRLGADPRGEQYRIEATAGEIVAYFNREMRNAGWGRLSLRPLNRHMPLDCPIYLSRPSLLFTKDGKTVGVLINHNGGTFTLLICQ